MKSITLKWLKNRNTYKELVKIFEEKFGKKATIKQIVDYLHEINRPDWEGWLMTQEPKITIAMIDNGANIHVHDDFVLFWATVNGYLDLVKLLVEKGVDIHAWDDYALRLAAWNGHLDLVKFLSKKGADIHTRDDGALRWAIEKSHLKVVKFLKNIQGEK